jgi:hypothetical protein
MKGKGIWCGNDERGMKGGKECGNVVKKGEKDMGRQLTKGSERGEKIW